jgi:DNA-binding MarR family transcriptional regulator
VDEVHDSNYITIYVHVKYLEYRYMLSRLSRKSIITFLVTKHRTTASQLKERFRCRYGMWVRQVRRISAAGHVTKRK